MKQTFLQKVDFILKSALVSELSYLQVCDMNYKQKIINMRSFIKKNIKFSLKYLWRIITKFSCHVRWLYVWNYLFFFQFMTIVDFKNLSHSQNSYLNLMHFSIKTLILEYWKLKRKKFKTFFSKQNREKVKLTA